LRRRCSRWCHTRALEITRQLDRERKLHADQRGWIALIGQELAKLPR